jgi:hypothetical protein
MDSNATLALDARNSSMAWRFEPKAAMVQLRVDSGSRHVHMLVGRERSARHSADVALGARRGSDERCTGDATG